MLDRDKYRLAERIAIGQACRCKDCECCQDYLTHMAEREHVARQIKHTIVPMHKSNYVVVSDLTLLSQLTRPGRY